MSAPDRAAPQLPNLAATRLSGDSVPSSSAPGSPPYEHSTQTQGFGMLPPHYASRPDVNVPLTADEKGKRATPPSSASQSSGSGGAGNGNASTSVDPASQPGRTFRSQGTRIAVTDPLADMRARNLSRPEGLGARSDYPTNAQRNVGGALPADIHPDAAAAAKAGAGVSSGGFVRPGFPRQNSNASSLDDDDHAGYDDFDWSDDEGVDEQAKFEEEQNNPDLLKKRSGRLAPSKIIRWLATTFLGNLIVSCSLIIPVVVMQFVYRPKADATDAQAARRDFIADNIQAWFIWAAFNLHIMWWLHILVELVPPVCMGVVRLLWGNVSQRVLTMAEWFNAIKGCIKPVFYAAMSWGSWAIIFNSIYGLYTRSNPATESRAKYLYRIYQVVEFFFFLTLTICAEQVLIKIIAMRFHKSSFAERIAEVTKALTTFDRLKDYRPRYGGGGTGTATPTHARGYSAFGIRAQTPRSAGYPPQDTAYMADSEGHASPSASPQRKTGGFFKRHAAKRPSPDDATGAMPARSTGAGAAPNTPGTINSTTGSAAGRAVRGAATTASTLARAAMNDPFNLLTNQGLGLSADVNNPREAKRLARSIFIAFRGQHKRSYLVPTDFEVAFPTPAEAKEAFAVFDRDGNGDISAAEIKTTVLSTYKERRFLSKSMQDVHHAVNQLDRILLFVAFIIVIFEALAIFDIDLGKTLTTFYTLAIAFAFIFKESAQAIWDSIIFIFVTHPFDTGDRICLADDVMTVKKMSLLSSEFVLWNGTSLFISNKLLSQMLIINYRRSGYQWESIALQIAFDTPLAKLDAAQADLIHWMQTEPERMFEPSTAIVPQTIDYMRSIEVTIGMTPRQNWQDWGGRFYKRNAFFAAICYYMKKHGVHYVSSNQPIIYWAEDAAQLPPSYDGAAPPPSATRDARRPSAASEMYEEETSAFPVDDFRPSPPSSPVLAAREEGTASGATTPRPPQPKPKSYMNFTPPPDEIEGSGLKRRKARPQRHAYNLQGGDG